MLLCLTCLTLVIQDQFSLCITMGYRLLNAPTENRPIEVKVNRNSLEPTFIEHHKDTFDDNICRSHRTDIRIKNPNRKFIVHFRCSQVATTLRY